MSAYLGQPSIHGDTVVFAADDDLWLVGADGGAAHRLGVGLVRTARPRLSPDGSLLAYTGLTGGRPEVHLYRLDGAGSERLTFQAAERCTVAGWSPDGAQVVYASTAERSSSFGQRLFSVPVAGGPADLLPWGQASAVSFGPHGQVVLGRSIADPARRKRYRGGAAGELWVTTTPGGSFHRLPLPDGNPVDPCWVAGRIWFLSDHSGRGNVWSVRPDGSDLRRHTDHDDFYARNLASDGERLVYQAGGDLYRLDPSDGDPPRRLSVRLTGVRPHRAGRVVPAADSLQSARLSPDGSQVSLVTRGQAFTLEPWAGPARRHGGDGVRYAALDRLADGRLVAVAADTRPGEHLAVLPGDPAEGPGEQVPLVDIGCVTELRAAPTGGQVAFATNRQQLWLLDTDTHPLVPRRVDTARAERIEDLAWSADGRWLAYTYPDTTVTSVIKVVEAPAGMPRPVTPPVFRDRRPAFDPSGRYLYFVGQRDLHAEPDQVQFGFSFPFGGRPYAVLLRPDVAVPFGPDRGSAPDGPADAGTDIDFDGIERRIVGLPVPEGSYAEIVGLPDRVLLLHLDLTAPDPASDGHRDDGVVTAVELAGGDVTAGFLDGIDEIGRDRTGDTVLIRAGHRLRVLPGDADPDAAGELDVPWAPADRSTGWLDLDRVRVEISPPAEWRQMFRETWRRQRESFHDSGMSDVDWAAMYRRYEPLVDRIGCRAELSDLIWELQGELATSHAYERGGDYHADGCDEQAFLGVDWSVEPGPAGAPVWRVARLLSGAPWNPRATSPFGRPGVDVRAGDAVLAVAGRPVGPRGPAELLVGRAGQEVEVIVARPGEPARPVAVRPIGDETRARYLDWTAGNAEYVHAASGGRIGYVHVPDMTAVGFADFVRGFLCELDREGLVVDVRFNCGGQVSPLLLERLARRRGGSERGRWSGRTSYPSEAPRGPMVVLINEETGSDGELFAHEFRRLGLGALVGRRTWGGTIATWPRGELVDGTVTTQPEFAFALDGADPALENHGVRPDVEIDREPSFGPAGDDPQLEVAVRSLFDSHLTGSRDADRWSGAGARVAAHRLGGARA